MTRATGYVGEGDTMDRTEHVVTNETTGGRKGQKLARFDLIPPRSMIALAEHFGRGAAKYEDRNWEKGYNWSLNFQALMRHMWLWWNGEDGDDGGPHLHAALWHACVLIEFAATHPELDDRPHVDLEFERLLAEEREIERRTRQHTEVTHSEYLELPEWRDQITWRPNYRGDA